MVSDYHRVNCHACREALSARLDGEDHPSERAPVDAHLAGCAACREWFDAAAAVTRLARTQVAVPPSRGVSDRVLAAAPTRRRARISRILHWVLGGLGAAQFLLAIAQATRFAGGAHVHAGLVATSTHLWHESAAWNLALGAGFLWVGARRARPATMMPVLTVFLATLTLLSLDDLATGGVRGVWLLSHGVVLAGYVIIMLLGRPGLDIADPPTRRRGPVDAARPSGPEPRPRPSNRSGRTGRGWSHR